MRSRSNSAASSKGPLESLRDELLIATPSKAVADRNTTGSDGSFEAGRCSSHRSSLPWGSDASSVVLPKHTVASDAELGTSPVSCTSNSQLQICPDDMLGMPSMEAEWPRLEVDEEQMVHGWSRSSGLSSTVDPAAYTFVLGLEQTHALTSGDGGSLSSAGSASAVGLTAQAVSEALAEHTRASSKASFTSHHAEGEPRATPLPLPAWLGPASTQAQLPLGAASPTTSAAFAALFGARQQRAQTHPQASPRTAHPRKASLSITPSMPPTLHTRTNAGSTAQPAGSTSQRKSISPSKLPHARSGPAPLPAAATAAKQGSALATSSTAPVPGSQAGNLNVTADPRGAISKAWSQPPLQPDPQPGHKAAGIASDSSLSLAARKHLHRAGSGKPRTRSTANAGPNCLIACLRPRSHSLTSVEQEKCDPPTRPAVPRRSSRAVHPSPAAAGPAGAELRSGSSGHTVSSSAADHAEAQAVSHSLKLKALTCLTRLHAQHLSNQTGLRPQPLSPASRSSSILLAAPQSDASLELLSRSPPRLSHSPPRLPESPVQRRLSHSPPKLFRLSQSPPQPTRPSQSPTRSLAWSRQSSLSPPRPPPSPPRLEQLPFFPSQVPALRQYLSAAGAATQPQPRMLQSRSLSEPARDSFGTAIQAMGALLAEGFPEGAAAEVLAAAQVLGAAAARAHPQAAAAACARAAKALSADAGLDRLAKAADVSASGRAYSSLSASAAPHQQSSTVAPVQQLSLQSQASQAHGSNLPDNAPPPDTAQVSAVAPVEPVEVAAREGNVDCAVVVSERASHDAALAASQVPPGAAGDDDMQAGETHSSGAGPIVEEAMLAAAEYEPSTGAVSSGGGSMGPECNTWLWDTPAADPVETGSVGAVTRSLMQTLRSWSSPGHSTFSSPSSSTAARLAAHSRIDSPDNLAAAASMGAASVATTTASAAVAASEARRSGEEHSSLMQALLLALAEAPAEEQADDGVGRAYAQPDWAHQHSPPAHAAALEPGTSVRSTTPVLQQQGHTLPSPCDMAAAPATHLGPAPMAADQGSGAATEPAGPALTREAREGLQPALNPGPALLGALETLLLQLPGPGSPFSAGQDPPVTALSPPQTGWEAGPAAALEEDLEPGGVDFLPAYTHDPPPTSPSHSTKSASPPISLPGPSEVGPPLPAHPQAAQQHHQLAWPAAEEPGGQPVNLHLGLPPHRSWALEDTEHFDQPNSSPYGSPLPQAAWPSRPSSGDMLQPHTPHTANSSPGWLPTVLETEPQPSPHPATFSKLGKKLGSSSQRPKHRGKVANKAPGLASFRPASTSSAAHAIQAALGKRSSAAYGEEVDLAAGFRLHPVMLDRPRSRAARHPQCRPDATPLPAFLHHPVDPPDSTPALGLDSLSADASFTDAVSVPSPQHLPPPPSAVHAPRSAHPSPVPARVPAAASFARGLSTTTPPSMAHSVRGGGKGAGGGGGGDSHSSFTSLRPPTSHSDAPPSSAPAPLEASLLQRWRNMSLEQSLHSAWLAQAMQPAPSSPKRARLRASAVMGTASPLLHSPDDRQGHVSIQPGKAAGKVRATSAPRNRGAAGGGCTTGNPPVQGQLAAKEFGKDKAAPASHSSCTATSLSLAQLPKAAGPAASTSILNYSLGLAANTPTQASKARPNSSSRMTGKGEKGEEEEAVASTRKAAQQAVISSMRPFGWQERETRQWLSSLCLELKPQEETLPFPDNPLRNGLLLCDIAQVVTGQAMRNLTLPPKDLHSARRCILAALDHLGLMSPALVEGSQLADCPRSSNNAYGSGTSTTPSGSYAQEHAVRRSYSLQLKEKQQKLGSGLLWEVEQVLQGDRDAIWGLLNYIRMATGPAAPSQLPSFLQRMRASAESAAAIRPLMASLRLSSNISDGLGPAGKPRPPCSSPAKQALATTAASSGGDQGHAHTSVTVQARSRHSHAAAGSPAVKLPGQGMKGSTPASTLQLASRPGAASKAAVAGLVKEVPEEEVGAAPFCSSGVGPLVFTTGPRPISPGRKEQLVSEAVMAHRKQEALMQHRLHALATQHLAALAPPATSAVAAGGQGKGATRGDPGPTQNRAATGTYTGNGLTRSLWPSPSLPYTSEQVKALEASLLRWLLSLGAITRTAAAQGFNALMPRLADGVFLCWLVQRLSGAPITGVSKKPCHEAAMRGNLQRALQAMRTMPAMSPRWLVYEESLLHCERATVTGILEDLHRLADGLPAAPSVLQPNSQPYLPYLSASQTSQVPALHSELVAMLQGQCQAPPSPCAEGPSPSPTPLSGRHASPPSSQPSSKHPHITAMSFVTPTKAQPSPAAQTGQAIKLATSRPAVMMSGKGVAADAGQQQGAAAASQAHTRERRAAAGLAAAPRLLSAAGLRPVSPQTAQHTPTGQAARPCSRSRQHPVAQPAAQTSSCTPNPQQAPGPQGKAGPVPAEAGHHHPPAAKLPHPHTPVANNQGARAGPQATGLPASVVAGFDLDLYLQQQGQAHPGPPTAASTAAPHTSGAPAKPASTPSPSHTWWDEQQVDGVAAQLDLLLRSGPGTQPQAPGEGGLMDALPMLRLRLHHQQAHPQQPPLLVQQPHKAQGLGGRAPGSPHLLLEVRYEQQS